MAWSQYVHAARELRAEKSLFFETSTGYKSVAPALTVMVKAEDRFTKLAEKLGFAPQTRETIEPVAQPTQRSASEELEARRQAAANEPIPFTKDA